MTTHAKLNAHDLRKVAVMAGTDPRTVSRLISGKPMRSTTADRVRQALAKLDYERTAGGFLAIND